MASWIQEAAVGLLFAAAALFMVMEVRQDKHLKDEVRGY